MPVTVLSGFLGSGKTTLLNRLLADPREYRIAVIVNEFGEVGIDGARLTGAERFVELDNGCLCCVLNEDLKRTLFELAERGGFDHLIIETTGLADPLPIAWTCSRPGLAEAYRLDAIVTVVDAAHLARVLDEAPEARLQIERADLVVLNKLDLVEDQGAAAVETVRSLNPHAPILPTLRGEVPTEIVLTSDRPSRVGELLRESPPVHHTTFEAFAFRSTGVFAEEALEDLLRALPRSVYRVKGLVRSDGDDAWVLVNSVAGRFEMEPLSRAPPPDQSALVFIGRDLEREDLSRRCREIVRDG